MKLVFICSSLEPGRDGVGDYTRRLAAEFVRQGHRVRILALNDKRDQATTDNGQQGQWSVVSGQQPAPTSALQPPTSDDISDFSISYFLCVQESDGTKVECLRLPSALSWDIRVKLARQWVEAFNPDWVSLQFVPFSFHPKGLCFGLGKKLTAINSKAPWHIMFHELWLGLGEKSSIKHRLLGRLQRSIFRDIFHRLRPRIVHTHAEAYQTALRRENMDAAILPLFSNIPLATGDAWADLIAPKLALQGSVNTGRSQFYLAGVFGAVHPQWNVALAVNTVLPMVQRFQKRLVLVFFGKSNLNPEMFSQLRAENHNRAEVIIAGERPTDEISKIMQVLDLGLATSPRQLIPKSGSVAAMLEHGLPVLVIRDDWQLRGNHAQPESKVLGLFSPEDFTRLEILPTKAAQPLASGLERIASRMLLAMELASSKKR